MKNVKYKFEMKFIIDGESKTFESISETISDCIKEIKIMFPDSTGFRIMKQEKVL
jgi:hypothetical protein